MNKAFVPEADTDDEEVESAKPLPAGLKNYITPAGYRRLQDEFKQLWEIERPALVQTITWAASNGDRSENGDYIYGKKRLREIDRRIRFLSKRLEASLVVDPTTRTECEQVFFGATVTVEHGDGSQRIYSIVGVDEASAAHGLISWVSPLARALLKAREDDEIRLQLPDGVEDLLVLAIEYREIVLPD